MIIYLVTVSQNVQMYFQEILLYMKLSNKHRINFNADEVRLLNIKAKLSQQYAQAYNNTNFGHETKEQKALFLPSMKIPQRHRHYRKFASKHKTYRLVDYKPFITVSRRNGIMKFCIISNSIEHFLEFSRILTIMQYLFSSSLCVSTSEQFLSFCRAS